MRSPILVDDSLKSVDTAEYLDRRQNLPRHPRLIPEGSHALQAAFRDAGSAHMPFLAPTDVMVSHPASSVFLQTKFEKMLGMKIEDVYPKDEERVAAWNEWKAEVSSVSVWFRKEDIWVMGTPSKFADFVLAFILRPRHCCGDDGME
ncbi:hypothetical protein BT96DRAFT_867669 [Gymnopus androsaceus JB14]|uniref:Glutathione S-transferase UstS-like C-terminal domain-containing protein n=1 Tax=Gymnopus androsaceus JB14 TaxID=1447944 RepID=A0A6A4GM74_9AGAR|nr:hypothetical protein BT96DRAFT_867669 [Gymnopus androsaceus JB14]